MPRTWRAVSRVIKLAIGVALLFTVAGCQSPEPHPSAAQAKPAALAPGVWLTRPCGGVYQHVWSLDGETLYYVEEQTLKEIPGNRQLSLASLKDEDSYLQSFLRWNSSGTELLVSGNHKAAILDAKRFSIRSVLPSGREYWWIGNTLCSVAIDDAVAAHSSPKAVQKWMFGDHRRQFPRGLSFDTVSPDGRALLLQVNGMSDGPFGYVLMLMDRDSGQVTSQTKVRTSGRLDMHGPCEVSWNETAQAAALRMDVSGGGTYMASVKLQDAEVDVRLNEDIQNSYPWAESMEWIDDTQLIVPIRFRQLYFVNNLEQTNDARLVALFDTRTRTSRVVYESESMVSFTASAKHVAIFEPGRIVMTNWKRKNGRILTTEYQPADLPAGRDFESGNYFERYIFKKPFTNSPNPYGKPPKSSDVKPAPR